MAQCDYCNQPIPKSAKFCNHCGEEQINSLLDEEIKNEPKNRVVSNNGFLTVLCILTLVGSVFGVFRGVFYQAVSEEFGNGGYARGWIYALLNIGTIAAAIIMLNKSKIGLYVYSVFQVLYLGFVIFTALYYTEDDMYLFAILVAMLFFIPSLAFLIMYWLPQNVKSMKSP